MDYPGKVITKTQVTPTQTSASGNWTLDDQAAAIKNNNWPVALVPNPISKSLRFNIADTAYLNRTFSTPTNNTVWSWSCWLKRSTLATTSFILGLSSDCGFGFTATDELRLWNNAGTTLATSTAVFRDPSAWYHIVFISNGTTIKGYVNNAEYLSYTGTVTNINSAIVHNIGRDPTGTRFYVGGYMTEINFIDGQALTPSDFGLTNPQTGQWIPKKYTGTYGTNGFYLNFKDETSTTTLGYDYSGNANNWTTNNFSVTAGAGNDSLTDVPTPWVAYNTTGDVGGVFRGNYCTLNPIVTGNVITPSNGNLESSLAASSNAYFSTVGTTAVSSGKWYWECTVTARDAGAGQWMQFGIVATTTTYTNNALGLSGNMSNGYAYYNDGAKAGQGTFTAGYGATFTTNNVIGIALDLDAKTITFYKDGVSQGQAFSGISATTTWLPIIQIYRSTGTTQSVGINFGQRPFAYTPPAGFRSLCTTNLPATAIGFGLTNQGDDYFNVLTYTGNGTDGRTVTGVGFNPDLVWVKGRSNSGANVLADAVRGSDKNLYTNLTDAETNPITGSSGGGIGTVTTDGFVLEQGTVNMDLVNTNTRTYVAWNWNAGGSNQTISVGQYSTSPNVPSIASTVRANTTSGFSIVTFTTNNTAGATVGHGCQVGGIATTPDMIIMKYRGLAANWVVYHKSMNATPQNGYLNLNTTAGYAALIDPWNNTAPSSTVITMGAGVGSAGSTNYGVYTSVAYCFAAVAGYSAFGSYTGNGSTDGPFIYTGFRPRYVMIKRTDSTGNWDVFDTSRDPYNATGQVLYPNLSSAEQTFSPFGDILSNGFKIRNSAATDFNANGGTYIYACFAEYPFQFANAR